MRYISVTKRYLLGLSLVLLGTLAAACGGSTQPAGQIHVLTWDGIVNPVMERYIDRGIDSAERSHASVIVIKLDTPGGLDSAMRDIIQRMEASTVPVIVYVSPSGGRAASAGTFITMAAQVAAMAPNTTIGAAAAINSDGSDIKGTLGKKIENDAVAYIRGIAELRGRNADWAEQAVREAVAVTQTQAVELDVVDFEAANLDDVLKQSDGRSVQVADAAGALTPVTLHTANVSVYDNNTNLFEEAALRDRGPEHRFPANQPRRPCADLRSHSPLRADRDLWGDRANPGVLFAGFATDELGRRRADRLRLRPNRHRGDPSRLRRLWHRRHHRTLTWVV